MLGFSSNKVACISDLHLGVHQNSPVWHDIGIQFAEWLDTTLKEKNIKDIIIAGDIFHNRHEIGVNTIHAAYRFFDILKSYNIIAITGNHDCYYKDKSDINSISILNSSKNITIFQELKALEWNNKNIVFCPWGIQPEEIPVCDILVGHFEIVNFKMNHHKVCDHGIETGTLIDKAKIIISGHFHFRDHRFYKNNRSILYLGSPYELDFGDRDQKKGISILDIETNDIEFIENTITPKHKKIKITDLIEETSKLSNLEQELKNNFISLCIDKNINAQTIDNILAKFAQYNPKHVRTEFNIFDTMQISATDIEGFSIDIDTALHEFVNLLDTQTNKKQILDKCLDLYKVSLVGHE